MKVLGGVQGAGELRRWRKEIQEVLPGVNLMFLSVFVFFFFFLEIPVKIETLFIILGCLDYASLETTPH